MQRGSSTESSLARQERPAAVVNCRAIVPELQERSPKKQVSSTLFCRKRKRNTSGIAFDIFLLRCELIVNRHHPASRIN